MHWVHPSQVPGQVHFSSHDLELLGHHFKHATHKTHEHTHGYSCSPGVFTSPSKSPFYAQNMFKCDEPDWLDAKGSTHKNVRKTFIFDSIKWGNSTFRSFPWVLWVRWRQRMLHPGGETAASRGNIIVDFNWRHIAVTFGGFVFLATRNLFWVTSRPQSIQCSRAWRL